MKKNIYSSLPLEERLLKKIITYYRTIWAEKKFNSSHHNAWLNNFSKTDDHAERINSLYLLSKFMFFGLDEIRELLVSLYRDKYKYSIVEAIRKANGDTTDIILINNSFKLEQDKTRFVGLGNSSESGTYLLYHFRTACNLPTSLFKNSSEIFMDGELAEKHISRYVFIDDFCGSGETGIKCNSQIEKIKHLNPSAEVYYYVLFSTESGLNNMAKYSKFDKVENVFLLNNTFKCFDTSSRYYIETIQRIDKGFAKTFAQKYGYPIVAGTPVEGHPLGFDDGQLLLAFSHNTPDNSLPIFWSDRNNWTPIFLRHIKVHNA